MFDCYIIPNGREFQFLDKYPWFKVLKNVDLECAALEACSKGFTSWFFLVVPDEFVFDFRFDPESNKVHSWGDQRILLINRRLLKEQRFYLFDRIEIDSNIPKFNYDSFQFDVFFLSYKEPQAEDNWDHLLKLAPCAKRVQNIKGIDVAHQTAAKLSRTDMFFVVDADARVRETFDFTFKPEAKDRNLVHVWRSNNKTNGLCYGYGGVKLFPRREVLSFKGKKIDFTTSVAGLRVMEEVSNDTLFDTSEFDAWKSAFRECTKLSSKIIDGQIDKDTNERLHHWCTVANGPYSKYILEGAKEGKEYGSQHKNDHEKLLMINDFEWLRRKFNERN